MGKLTKMDFEKSGYNEYEPNFTNQFATSFLQKRVLDKKGKTKYFIDVWFYDNDFEVELTLEKKHYVMRILVYCIDDKYYDLVELLEKEIEKIWESMGKPYYGSER